MAIGDLSCNSSFEKQEVIGSASLGKHVATRTFQSIADRRGRWYVQTDSALVVLRPDLAPSMEWRFGGKIWLAKCIQGSIRETGDKGAPSNARCNVAPSRAARLVAQTATCLA